MPTHHTLVHAHRIMRLRASDRSHPGLQQQNPRVTEIKEERTGRGGQEARDERGGGEDRVRERREREENEEVLMELLPQAPPQCSWNKGTT